jgi:hypothetical protein
MPFQKKRNRSKIGRITPKKTIQSPVKGERGKLTCREVDLRRIRRQFRINDFEKATGTVVQQRKRPKTKGYVKTTLAVKTQRRIDKWRNKCGDLTTLVKGLRLQFVHVLHALDETRAMYEHKVAGLEGDIAKLQHEPDEGSDDDDPTVDDEGFVTFKDPDGSIQFELSIVIRDLPNLGVSQRTIWPAIKSVYQTLCGHTLDMSVSTGTMYTMTHRLGVLTDFQIGYSLKVWDAANMSAFHDGTSHRGRSIQGSQLQLGGFIMSLGV